MIARSFSPPLTTVRQPLADIGYAAYAALQDLITGRREAPLRVELATLPVIRDSTAPPPG